MRASVLAAFVSVALLAPAVRAQARARPVPSKPAERTDAEKATIYCNLGQANYDMADYEDALDSWKRCLELRRDPAVLLSIAPPTSRSRIARAERRR